MPPVALAGVRSHAGIEAGQGNEEAETYLSGTLTWSVRTLKSPLLPDSSLSTGGKGPSDGRLALVRRGAGIFRPAVVRDYRSDPNGSCQARFDPNPSWSEG